MAAMPEFVKVGPHTYPIIRRSVGEMKELGLCSWDQVQISIRKGLRKSKSQEVLLHEVLHTCTYPNMAAVSNKTDEDFVDVVAPLLLQVLQDNPQLVEYLVS